MIKYNHFIRRFFPLFQYDCFMCDKQFRLYGWKFEAEQFITINGIRRGHEYYLCSHCGYNKQRAHTLATAINKFIWRTMTDRLNKHGHL